jgi:hypothetical protein
MDSCCEIKVSFSTFESFLKITHSQECPSLLFFYGYVPLDWWNAQLLEPLVLQIFPVCSSGIAFDSFDKYCLVFEDGHEKGLFLLVKIGNVQEKAAISLVKLSSFPMAASLHLARAWNVKEPEIFVQKPSDWQKELLDLMKKEYKERAKLILSATQTQRTPSQQVSTPSPASLLSNYSNSQPVDFLRTNKDRLKKYMLYELKKIGVDRDHAEFPVYWKSLYTNCQFKLRKDLATNCIKREILFNCVKSNLESLLER